jgi:hypothetical protein
MTPPTQKKTIATADKMQNTGVAVVAASKKTQNVGQEVGKTDGHKVQNVNLRRGGSSTQPSSSLAIAVEKGKEKEKKKEDQEATSVSPSQGPSTRVASIKAQVVGKMPPVGKVTTDTSAAGGRGILICGGRGDAGRGGGRGGRGGKGKEQTLIKTYAAAAAVGKPSRKETTQNSGEEQAKMTGADATMTNRKTDTNKALNTTTSSEGQKQLPKGPMQATLTTVAAAMAKNSQRKQPKEQ